MSYYPEPDSYIENKVKLDLSNHAIKKELEHVAGVETSDIAAKKRLY